MPTYNPGGDPKNSANASRYGNVREENFHDLEARTFQSHRTLPIKWRLSKELGRPRYR